MHVSAIAFFSLSKRKSMCVCQRTIIRTWNISLNSVHTSFQRHTYILSKCYTISKIMHAMRYIFMRLDRRWIALLAHSNVCYGKKDVAKIVRTSQHRLCGKFSSNHFTTLLIFVSLSLLRSIFFFVGWIFVRVHALNMLNQRILDCIGWSVFMSHRHEHNVGIMLLSSHNCHSSFSCNGSLRSLEYAHIRHTYTFKNGNNDGIINIDKLSTKNRNKQLFQIFYEEKKHKNPNKSFSLLFSFHVVKMCFCDSNTCLKR